MQKGNLFDENSKISYTIENGEAVIYTCDDDGDSMVIPSELGGCPVTKIMPYAYSGKHMKYIRFPEQLHVIDHHGFSECRRIEHLDFPGELRTIGNYAFYNCIGVTFVHLTPYIKSIGFGAFKNCEKLTEVIQDKKEDCDISIGSILDDLNQAIHVTMRHLHEDGSYEDAKVTFTEHYYEVVANVASMCKQFESTEFGSGKYMRYCLGMDDVDYTKYDSMFYVLLRGDPLRIIVTVAMDRLMFPYMLKDEYRAQYIDYLKEHALEAGELFVRDVDMDKLHYFLSLDVLGMEDTDRLIDEAAEMDKPALTSVLMDYRHSHFSMADVTFDL